MALIVNADDLGMNEGVNAAICEAFEKGLIDRTTMLVNMPFAKEAMDLARKAGFADRVGLHLNLTSGRPLTDAIAKDPVMCDDKGMFTADFARNMKTRFFLPKTTARNIENELMAQMERYAELGGTLWHIDSHHHVHTDPSVWRILKKIFRNRSVSSVRLGRNMYRGGGLLGHIYKLMLNRSIKRYCEKPQRYFGSMEDYLEFTKDGALPSSGADDEVMVHPVYDDKGRLSDVTGGKFSELVRLH